MSMRSFIFKREENQDAVFIQRFLKKGNYFIDVGANIGTITIPAALAVGPTGRVFSIEPHPETFSCLKYNVTLNYLNNVLLTNCAIGDVNGKTRLTSLNEDRNHVEKNSLSEDTIEVDCKRLDDIPVLKNLNVDLLKVDVEGFEYFVFKGAERILCNTGCIYFELDSKNYAQYNVLISDIIKYLEDFGFNLYRLDDASLSKFIFEENIVYSLNLVALKDINDFTLRTNLILN
jgi:FkbM family methyltransferase